VQLDEELLLPLGRAQFRRQHRGRRSRAATAEELSNRQRTSKTQPWGAWSWAASSHHLW